MEENTKTDLHEDGEKENAYVIRVEACSRMDGTDLLQDPAEVWKTAVRMKRTERAVYMDFDGRLLHKTVKKQRISVDRNMFL